MGNGWDASPNLAHYKVNQLHGAELARALMDWIDSGKRDLALRNRVFMGCRWIPAGVAMERARGLQAPELFDDLLSAGEEGLLFAIGKADPVKLATFKTYAWACAGGYVQEAITREHSSLIVSQETYDRRHKVMKSMRSSDVSLNQPVAAESEETFQDLLVADKPSVVDVVAAAEMKERLSSALMTLDPCARFVVTQRIFEDVPGPTVAQQWAERTGRLYTNANIHVIYKKGLARLFTLLGGDAGKALSDVAVKTAECKAVSLPPTRLSAA